MTPTVSFYLVSANICQLPFHFNFSIVAKFPSESYSPVISFQRTPLRTQRGLFSQEPFGYECSVWGRWLMHKLRKHNGGKKNRKKRSERKLAVFICKTSGKVLALPLFRLMRFPRRRFWNECLMKLMKSPFLLWFNDEEHFK